MKKGISKQEHNGFLGKTSIKRYILAIVILSLFLISISILKLPTDEDINSKPQLTNETIILKTAAAMINKEPNELTADDFTKIWQLQISEETLSDLKPLEKFPNLQTLVLYGTKVTDLNPIKGLTNLQCLGLSECAISNIEPIKELKDLRLLWINRCKNITDEQIEELKKTFPELRVIPSL